MGEVLSDVDIEIVKPYDKNYLDHEKNSEHIMNSIKDFGYNKVSIVVDENNVLLAGHGTLGALRKLGYTKIPHVYQVKGLTENQKKAYRIADNSSGANAEVIEEFLIEELKDIGDDFKLSDYGLDFELPDASFAPGAEEDTPDIPEDPHTVMGDIYNLGIHTLYCADAVEHKVIINCVLITDPPYNVSYQSRVDEERRKNWGLIKNDNMSPEDFQEFLETTCYQYSHKYVFCNWQSYSSFESALDKPKSLIVWDKESIGLGANYRSQHEFLMFYGKLDTRSESNLWRCKRDNTSSYKHPTQKPVELVDRILKNCKEVNVLDLFAGSGSTLIACVKNKKTFTGYELEPKYCDVIVKRWEDYTSKKAKLVA